MPHCHRKHMTGFGGVKVCAHAIAEVLRTPCGVLVGLPACPTSWLVILAHNKGPVCTWCWLYSYHLLYCDCPPGRMGCREWCGCRTTAETCCCGPVYEGHFDEQLCVDKVCLHSVCVSLLCCAGQSAQMSADQWSAASKGAGRPRYKGN